MPGCNFYYAPRDMKALLPIKLWTKVPGEDSDDGAKMAGLVSGYSLDMLNKAAMLCHGYSLETAFPYVTRFLAHLKSPDSLWDDPNVIISIHTDSDYQEDLHAICPALFDNHRAEYRDKLLRALEHIYQIPVSHGLAYWNALCRLCALERTVYNRPKDWEALAFHTFVQKMSFMQVMFAIDGCDNASEKFITLTPVVSKSDANLLDVLLNRMLKYLGNEFEAFYMRGSFDLDDYFVSNGRFCVTRLLKPRPNISHLWATYGDFSMAARFGCNFEQSIPVDTVHIKELMQDVQRLSIYNVRRDEAYEIDLKDIPDAARKVMEYELDAIERSVSSC